MRGARKRSGNAAEGGTGSLFTFSSRYASSERSAWSFSMHREMRVLVPHRSRAPSRQFCCVQALPTHLPIQRIARGLERRLAPSRRSARILVSVILAVLGRAAAAQAPASPPSAATVAELEQRLPTLAGVARARALATLTDGYKLDQAAKAVAAGSEALRLFATFPDSSAQVLTLNELAWAYMTLGKYDQAVAHAERGRALARAIGDSAGIARGTSNLGSIAQRRGDPDDAVAFFTEALEIQRAIRADRETSNSLNNLGFVYSTDLAEYDKALAYHTEALAIRERLGDKNALALTLNNIGIVYGRLRQHGRALEYYGRALALRRELGGKARIAATLNNIGDAYFEMGDYPRALDAHRESLLLRETVKDRSAVSLSHRNLALIYLAMGKRDSARRELNDALRISETTGDKGLAVRNLLALAAIDRTAGHTATARRAADSALAIARGMNSRENVRRSLEEIAATQERSRDYAGALATYKAFKAVSDSIFDGGTARRITNLQRRFEAERHDRELERLRKEEAVHLLDASRRTWQRNAIAAVALLVAVIGVVIYRRRAVQTRLAEELSVTDALTGVRNRRYLQQTIDVDLAASTRRHRAALERRTHPEDADLVFYLLDIDHFKQVNDRYGHVAGDRLLIDLARVLRETCRESDVVLRWGGEEFLIFARFADRELAAAQAERIRAAVERHTTTLDGGRSIRATCSIGFAVFPFAPEWPEALGWQRVIAFADHGTYAAKRAGRNAWVGYSGATAALPLDVVYPTPAEIDDWIAKGWITRVASRSDEVMGTSGDGAVDGRTATNDGVVAPEDEKVPM
jgi:diguanylate cyclase (GGDEF)-like protein